MQTHASWVQFVCRHLLQWQLEVWLYVSCLSRFTYKAAIKKQTKQIHICLFSFKNYISGMLNESADLESQKRSLLCYKHSAWLMDPNNQHSVQWLLNFLWKQGLVMHALPQTYLRLTGLLRHEHTDWLPGMWQRLKKLCLIHQSLISEPQIRQTNMILNVRIVYWIRIRSSQWLTSRIHGHHHMLCFLPRAALLGLCCRRIQSLHVCESFCVQFCI